MKTDLIGRALCLELMAALIVASPAAGQSESEEVLRQHFEAAKLAETSGDFEKAAAEYLLVLRSRPRMAEARTNLGLVYYRQGKNSEAIEAFQQS